MTMKKYIGTKTIEAQPMNHNDWLELKGDSKRSESNQSGYHVRYPDGYESWSPKDVFEKAYHELLFEQYPIPDDADQDEHRIPATVYPSDERTIAVAYDHDYKGAHRYQFMNSLGFSNGVAQYEESFQEIQFVQKNEDGSMTPGLQSEQLILALIDRTEKLNAKYASEYNGRMIAGLKMFLMACHDRIDDRIKRGVMGDLKK